MTEDPQLKLQYLVGNGEHISLVAEELGFANFETILDAEENSSLRAARTNPHQLVPDDLLVIPAQEPHPVEVPIDATFRVVIKRQKLFLRLKVLDLFGAPVASTVGTLEAQGESIPVTTDDEGFFEAPIPRSTRKVELRIDDLAFTILVGALQPASFTEGIRARLTNLGCWAGQPQGGDVGTEGEFALGIELMQEELGVPVDGQLNPGFVQQLVDKHGQ